MSGRETSPRRFKDGIYEQCARIGKAIARPRRLELLDLLRQAPRTVEGLAGLTDHGMANVSQPIHTADALVRGWRQAQGPR